MAEIGKATVKIVPDTSGFSEALDAQIGKQQTKIGGEFLLIVVSLILLVCSPAIVWAVYGWAF